MKNWVAEGITSDVNEFTCIGKYVNAIGAKKIATRGRETKMIFWWSRKYVFQTQDP